MKRAFIVHGWSGKPDEHWLPWLEEQLEQRGFEVHVPAMPNPDEPVIDEWVSHLARLAGPPDEQTYFIGHSLGCQTIMRYLESQSDRRAAGCVFVAGWLKLANLESKKVERTAKPWLTTPINFTAVRAAAGSIAVLLSDNDDYGAVAENEKIFRQKLNADVAIMHNGGHFTAADGVTELPAALAALELMQTHEPPLL